ncbi:MAG: serine/threonine protein kinase [Candidatus Margulisbacteria bacterium]|nr:serine/threonine protein kinase [Candidatus Margulisiibacteriota bacterium]MBU1021065.1 serine/threonine protein kinase [Candidatus Margulisiibacteriota bacterium]MBU1729740.1 serine/threonine protein kinase [Candidatus Margulisiibacteriota bacterium]MBU1956005.1 serine/threonine protein kinase [Candidatus Margulisiibacteriota bacterium]
MPGIASAIRNVKRAIQRPFFGRQTARQPRLSRADTLPPGAVSSLQNYPSRIGDYTIDRQIGSGGFGLVYRGHSRATDKYVAIKAFHEGVAPEFLHREKDALFALEHVPGVPTFEEVITEGNRQYLAMEFIPGETVDAQLRTRRLTGAPFTPTETRDILLNVLAIHQGVYGIKNEAGQGMVHRDLKPGNIMWRSDSRQHVLLDFGLATHEKKSVDGDLLCAEHVRGTPAYMAPENFRGFSAHLGSEFYAVGIMAYELLTGRTPYRVNESRLSNGAMFNMYAKLHGNKKFPALPLDCNLEGQNPLVVQSIINHFVSKLPTKRPRDHREAMRIISALAPRDLGEIR